MKPPVQKATRRRKAQTIVEFALILPLLIIVFLAIMEFGRMLLVYITVASASREGARYGTAVGGGVAGAPRYLDCIGMQNAAIRVGVLAGIQTSDITITYDNGTGTPISPISVCDPSTVPPTVPEASTLPLGSRVVVYVSVPYSTIVPIPYFDTTFDIQSQTARTIVKEVAVGTSEPPPPPLPPGVPSSTPTETWTPTSTPTKSPTPTDTPSPTPTSTDTPTPTDTSTATPTPTGPTSTATSTPTPTETSTITPTPTESPTPTETLTPTVTPTATPVCQGIAVQFGTPGGKLDLFITNTSSNPITVVTIDLTWPNANNKNKAVDYITVSGSPIYILPTTDSPLQIGGGFTKQWLVGTDDIRTVPDTTGNPTPTAMTFYFNKDYAGGPGEYIITVTFDNGCSKNITN